MGVGRSINRCGWSLAQQKSQIASLEALTNSQVGAAARPGADARQPVPAFALRAAPCVRNSIGDARARRGPVGVAWRARPSVAWQEVDEFMKMNHAQVGSPPPGRVPSGWAHERPRVAVHTRVSAHVLREARRGAAGRGRARRGGVGCYFRRVVCSVHSIECCSLRSVPPSHECVLRVAHRRRRESCARKWTRRTMRTSSSARWSARRPSRPPSPSFARASPA
jgi:hypothetical protein